MGADVPTIEPTTLTAGDTWTWERTLADYPAPTWVLSYRLLSQAGEIAISASADGSDHLVSVAKATTAAYKAGLYKWFASVTDGTSRYQVGAGLVTVLPDPAAAGAGFDPRSHARRVLEAIEAVIEGRATKDQEEYSIGSRSLKRTPIAELLELRDRYRAEVRGEELAEGIANGQAAGQRLLARL